MGAAVFVQVFMHVSFTFTNTILSIHVSSLLVGLGFRQVGQRAFLMVSTNKKVYSIYVSENDKKVVV